MDSHEIVLCPKCSTHYRIPRSERLLKITCSHCHAVFYNSVPSSDRFVPKKYAIQAIAVAVLAIVTLLVWVSTPKVSHPSSLSSTNSASVPNSTKSEVASAGLSNWITISYSALVDMSTLTHSGKTVGNVVREIPTYTDDIMGQVQPYLEPYSVLCHDILLASVGPDTLPLINITSEFPVGSEQPAWVALAREGEFQIYFNSKLIRVFVKGSDPSIAFRENQSVLRNPLLNIVDRYKGSLKTLEVYAFENSFASLELRLNTIPVTYSVPELDLAAKHRPIDLSSIEDLLKENVTLEAVEVDAHGDLCFYGKKGDEQTIAGYPVALSDIAVVYRSIFHYGFNAPYISLDKNEDNRYAKVNFGGHLENTRVGHVVLEADKLFKMLSTGMDPNTFGDIRSRIGQNVPGFMTEDERSLMEEKTEGHSQIRYWFYPDSIGTVTDGSLGVVLTYQFLAAVERMDDIPNVSPATKKTISHLNEHFVDYENAETTYKELSTVGRIMALVNWMKGMNIADRVELDDFLSVTLPSSLTPPRTKKMLAVSAITSSEQMAHTFQNVREFTKVAYLSRLLDEHQSSTTDDEFLGIASHSIPGIAESAPPEYKRLKSTVESYEREIEARKSEIADLDAEMERTHETLDRSNEDEINSYNAMVSRYNGLLETQRGYIEAHNSAVEDLNGWKIGTAHIVSIGGGIDLSPKEFKLITRDIASPRVLEVRNIERTMQAIGKIAKSGEWVRSAARNGGVTSNLLTKREWTMAKTTAGQSNYSYRPVGTDGASMDVSFHLKDWMTSAQMNGCENVSKFSVSTRRLQVKHTGLGVPCEGVASFNGSSAIFSR